MPTGKDDNDPLTAEIPMKYSMDLLQAAIPMLYKVHELQCVCLACIVLTRLTLLKIPKSSVFDSIQDREVLDHYDKAIELLRTCGATIVEGVNYATWNRTWNKQAMGFVWGQLKKS